MAEEAIEELEIVELDYEHASQELWEALFALQGEGLQVVRNEDGQVGSRHYKYSTLTEVNAIALPRLTHYGLLWLTWPALVGGEGAMGYMLRHVASGGFIRGLIKTGVGREFTAQEQGSGLTYGRRYTLTPLCNIVPADVDDDAAMVRRRRGDPPVTQKARREMLAELKEHLDAGMVPLFLGSIAVTNIAENWTEADLVRIRAGLEKRAELQKAAAEGAS